MGLQNLKGCFLGNVKRYKGRLEANDLTQKKGIDYHGMSAHFELELHQKDVKNNFFLNRILRRRYIRQLKVLLITVRKLAN
jgi:hypothetical protein